MILELLQPDASALDALTVLLRAAYHIATLGAAGLVLVLVFLGPVLQPDEQEAARRWLVAAALSGIGLSVLALGLRAAVLSAEGLSGALRAELYPAILGSRIGDAFGLRVAGLALCLAACARAHWGLAVGAVGAFLAVGSYAAMGHSTLYRPRQGLAVVVVVHLLAVAYWFASLPVLRRVALGADGARAARVMRAFARQASLAVALLLAAGTWGITLLIPRTDLAFAGSYGLALAAKLLLAAGLLGFAAWHRWRLAPALAAGEPGAGPRLARSIGREALLFLVVFYAAAELVSVHPVDGGHRIAG